MMNPNKLTSPPEHASESAKANIVELTFPRRMRLSSSELNFPAALVASSDETILDKLVEITIQCGLTTFRAFTVGQCRRTLATQEVSLVVCDDRLADGDYNDVVRAVASFQGKTPVIVVSPTGDWEGYLTAIAAGAFDYLAYPPVPGDLPKAIRYALLERAASARQKPALRFPISERGKHNERHTNDGSTGR